MKLSIRPLNIKDIDIFSSWIEYYRKKSIIFIFRNDLNEGYIKWFKRLGEHKKENKKDLNEWLIFLLNNKPIGAINYKDCIEEAEVSILLDPRWKNKGYGKFFLMLADKYMIDKYQLEYLYCEPLSKECTRIFEYNNYHRSLCGDMIKIIKNE